MEKKRTVVEKKLWESFKAEGGEAVSRLRSLIRQGNLRRVVVDHKGRTVAEFPLTAGVVGLTFAPVLAAIGAIVALLSECTIHVEMAPTKAAAGAPAEHAPLDVEC